MVLFFLCGSTLILFLFDLFNNNIQFLLKELKLHFCRKKKLILYYVLYIFEIIFFVFDVLYLYKIIKLLLVLLQNYQLNFLQNICHTLEKIISKIIRQIDLYNKLCYFFFVFYKYSICIMCYL